MSSIKDQAIAYVYVNPGQTASQISKAIGVKRTSYGYGTVSSLLCKAANAGLIRRELSHKDVWQYYPKVRTISEMTYKGWVLEDLKQMSYVLGAIGEHRLADAARHALQILDRNRDVIVAYEKEQR